MRGQRSLGLSACLLLGLPAAFPLAFAAAGFGLAAGGFGFPLLTGFAELGAFAFCLGVEVLA